MFILLFIAFYFLYSVPPLRLKRFFPVSTVIIGIEALLAFLAGEFAFAKIGVPTQLPQPLLWLIFLVFLLSSNIKDLKDFAGDKQTGVFTLPVLVGETRGRRLIAFLVFTSYCFVPILLPLVFEQLHILVVSLVFALASFIYISRKNAQEDAIFFTYFIYVFFLLVSVSSLGR
jgi:4-hydroxybenzoate polyprenyltransferase